jgi:very-short-patch-repair endonuclease
VQTQPPFDRQPFTWAQARSAGLTKHQLRSTAWRHVFRDVWVSARVPDSRELRFASARLALPQRAVVCGLSAAWLHGADVRRQNDLDVHAGFPKGMRCRPRAGLVVCQETLDPADITVVDGVQVTTPLRTAFDCLRWLRATEGVVVADALAHAGLVDVAELRAYFATKRRLRNLRVGQALLDWVEPKSESPMESRTRCRLLLHGFPRPVAQWVVVDDWGEFVARVDLAYPELKIAIEYDGAAHWEQRRADDRRRDALRALGWQVIVVSAEDLYATSLGLEAMVQRARRTAAAA